ncbi:unnamed protein product [Phytomonas sp. Hart1]|nr:unnamed protein product [Phytomonas sp. Hart1]|eukprot:CCW71725.1 unnamed protein product [Phytomonas sp. isolate Hart1]
MEINSTLIECYNGKNRGQLLFNLLILDAPTPSNLPIYIKELQRRGIHHLVQVCGPTYDKSMVERSGITVHTWAFDDGGAPPSSVVDSWLRLLQAEKTRLEEGELKTPSTIGVHCVAGLGRAPILVALAMVEFNEVDPQDAILMIRSKRRGAINQVQMQWLMKYKRRQSNGNCVML